MRICTITCHDVYNHGASLQAYALQTYLNSLGNDVKIINYKPDYLSNHFRLNLVANPKYNKPFVKEAYLLAKLPGRLATIPRKKAFDAFTSENLKRTKRYNSYVELEADPPVADVYFAGSDQIWNPIFPNGKDPTFYLNFVKKGICASYAASFAVEAFPEELKSKTSKYLKNFDYISVRERSGIDILESMDVNNGTVVLDPVFLLDKEQWDKMAKTPCKNSEPYILVYDFDNSPEIQKAAQNIAQQNNLKIYSVFKNSYADKCFGLCDPKEFLGLVKNASFVLSNSFHGTAFAIIFQKEFLVIERSEKINTRMRDFTKLLGLDDRMTKIFVNVPKKINWDEVLLKLKKETDSSKRYIDKVLGRGKSEKENSVCN